MIYFKMYTIILNINNIFNILFKYKYNFYIKLYLNDYIKTYILITYIIKYYFISNININKHNKNRSLINFSNKKIRIQKGLGKARLRNFSSPICRSGACVFGPLNIRNMHKYNNLTFKLVYIYLLINKRSNIIIYRFENILFYIIIIYFNKYSYILKDVIYKILYLKGIIVSNFNNYIFLNLYKIKLDLNLNKFINIKYVILNLLKYNYIIFLI